MTFKTSLSVGVAGGIQLIRLRRLFQGQNQDDKKVNEEVRIAMELPLSTAKTTEETWTWRAVEDVRLSDILESCTLADRLE